MTKNNIVGFYCLAVTGDPDLFPGRRGTLQARKYWINLETGARRPVSRVLSGPCGRGRPFLWDAPCSAPHATNPGSRARMPLRHTLWSAAGHPYSVLLPVGFTLPPPLPEARCALAAPFHPYLQALQRAGGLFSVALSLGSPPPAVNRHRIPVEPGLSSTPGQGQRPSSRLAEA